MKTHINCIPCILRQSIELVQISVEDRQKQAEVINKVLSFLTTVDYTTPPPVIGQEVFQIIYQITGNVDPYSELKRKNNQLGLTLYDELLRLVYKNPEPVLMAAKLAVAGNVIDFRRNTSEIDLYQIIHNIEQLHFEINHFDQFIDDLKRSRSVLYIADNAGEIVFDRLFIEILQRYYPEIGLRFTVAVRGAPVLNDATREDAEMVGLDKIAQVVDNGNNAPATVLNKVSDEMRRAYEEADLIIAKGMGNYETLDEEDRLIYYLLRVKCSQVGQIIGAQEGSLVLKRNENYKD